jgi:transcription initiation factor TFIIIB Brf1 subunit/transcription initiation factor TFIIB
LKITFLYIKGCPNAEPSLNLLKEVLSEKSIDAEIEVKEIASEEDAKEYHFLGSPTIQINGLDIEIERRNDPPVLGCRVYRTERGYSSVPPRELIARALNETKKGNKGAD